MAPEAEPRDWKVLAEQASKEMDGPKLTILIEQLCAGLDCRAVSAKSVHATPKTDVVA
jgi:hypothetical protein